VRAAVLGCIAVLAGACGGSDEPAGPVVDAIPAAIAEVEQYYGGPQEYFEISAGLDGVGFVVAVDGATAAEQGSYDPETGLIPPTPVGEASGETFTADQIDVDPDRIFDQLRSELDDPVIVDFAIQGGPNDTVLYDASVASDGGGVLLVLLGADGTILGVQGR
jgi:hypothetical protein